MTRERYLELEAMRNRLTALENTDEFQPYENSKLAEAAADLDYLLDYAREDRWEKQTAPESFSLVTNLSPSTQKPTEENK